MPIKGESALLIFSALAVFWIDFVVWWYTRRISMPLLFRVRMLAVFAIFGLWLASQAWEWSQAYFWWLLPLYLSLMFASGLVRIDRSRAPRFFWVKLSLLLILLAALTLALKPKGAEEGSRWHFYFLIVAGALFLLVNVFRPKNAYITADPASTPPAASCSPRSPGSAD